MITIRGKSYEGDFFDVDFMESYEKAVGVLQSKTQEVQKATHQSTAGGFRALISVVDEFFDSVLGEGASSEIFEGSEGNVRVHLEAVEELNGQIAEQKAELNNITNRYTQKQTAKVKPFPRHVGIPTTYKPIYTLNDKAGQED